MISSLKLIDSHDLKSVKERTSAFTYILAIIAVGCILFVGTVYAQDKQKWDPAWDKIDSKATKVDEFEGGQLYKQNAIHIVVLN